MSAIFGIKRLPDWAQPQLGKTFPASLAKWTTRVLVLILAWTLGRLVWFWVPSPPPSPTSATAVATTAGQQQPAYQLDQLVNRHFFGRYNAAPAPVVEAPAPVVEAPRTKLNLTLVGLVASSEPDRGLAVIANRGSQKTYGIGEAIEGTRVILRQVMSDRVILRNSGRDETLMLAGVDYNDRERAPQPAPVREPVEQDSGEGDLSSVKAEIMNNPQALLKYITLSQERNDEGLVGYRIGPGSDNRLFQEAGLQEGDIAVSINGADLANPAEMNRIWQSLSDASEISLTVQRDGQLHDIYIGL